MKTNLTRFDVILALLVLMLAAACSILPGAANAAATPTPGPGAPVSSDDPPTGGLPPYAPREGDDALMRGAVFIDTVEVLTLESYPPQFMLALKGSLPTPCHQLRIVVGEPVDGTIAVEVYSLVDASRACVQALEPFEANVPLGSLPQGQYRLGVNDLPAVAFGW